MSKKLILLDRGVELYEVTFAAMKAEARAYHQNTVDALWLVEHPPVYTQGQAGKSEHLLDNPLNIPVQRSDRGGQITYHGPGQIICYLLLNLKHYSFNIRTLVRKIEQAVINLLKRYDIGSESRCDAPGVYAEGKKICSIGLRIKKYYTYHGLALNVDMDLKPFDFINPCGYSGLKITQMKNLSNQALDQSKIKKELIQCLMIQLEEANYVKSH